MQEHTIGRRAQALISNMDLRRVIEEEMSCAPLEALGEAEVISDEIVSYCCRFCKGGCLQVNKVKNIWRCAHCKNGGDAFSFIMLSRKIGFEEAVGYIEKILEA